MNKEMSLDVALDIIGTLRMMKIDELSKETDPIKIEILEKEFNVLTIEERIAQGLNNLKAGKTCAYQSWIRYKTIMHPN